MQPEQPPAPPSLRPGTTVGAGQTSNQYDFIMNPPKPKRHFFGGGNSNPKQRVLLMVAAGGGILVVLILFASLLSGGNGNVEKLINLAQQQQEVVRVANVGVEKAHSTTTKNLAINTSLAVQTSQNQTIARLKQLGQKLNAKTLALKKSAATDQALTTAALNNRFDEVFTETVTRYLTTYQGSVKELYDITKNATEKDFLATAYNGINILKPQPTTSS